MDDNKNEIEKLIEGANQSIAQKAIAKQLTSTSLAQVIEKVIDPELDAFATSAKKKVEHVKVAKIGPGEIHFIATSGFYRTDLRFCIEGQTVRVATHPNLGLNTKQLSLSETTPERIRELAMECYIAVGNLEAARKQNNTSG